MLDATLPAVVNAQQVKGATEETVTTDHMKIVVHEIHAAKDPPDRHQPIAAGVFQPQYLAIMGLHDLFQTFAHVRAAKHRSWVGSVLQRNPSFHIFRIN